MRSACPGSVVERIGVPLEWFVIVRGHKLWRNGPWVWCARCGCYSQQRAVGLARDCRPKTERASREFGNLRRGRERGGGRLGGNGTGSGNTKGKGAGKGKGTVTQWANSNLKCTEVNGNQLCFFKQRTGSCSKANCRTATLGSGMD